ncbi:MAG TPA: hypothetical protein VND93_18375 [Myxococcales bacterium]|nr:hypothetical protein [Myxococcales bacterium]
MERPRLLFSKALARASLERGQGHLASAAEVQRTRAGHQVEARRLQEVRSDAFAATPSAGEQVQQRIARELEGHPPLQLVTEVSPQAPAAAGTPAAPEGQPQPPAPAPRVDSALQLVERIEVLLRSGQPRLELSVGGQFHARVLLERTGPGEVAVTIRGRYGPPPPDELARVRDQLRNRGLKLSSLCVG